MARAETRASLSHRGERVLFALAERVVAARSWDRRVRLGARLGRAWHLLDARHRGIARDNMGLAFPQWSAGELRKVVRAHFEHLGITAAEFVGLCSATKEEVVERSRLEGLEHLEEARSLGRGVFLLTGHLGNWELAGAAVAARGFPVSAVGRRLANPLMDRRVRELRERFGGRIIAHRNAVRPILQALREGGMVAFLLDQRAPRREAVTSRFFDQPVATNQGLALLALKTGAPVVPGFDHREGGRHVLRVLPALEAPVSGTREERVERFTRAFDETIESEVRRRPEQWFWVHKRWKMPEGLGA